MADFTDSTPGVRPEDVSVFTPSPVFTQFGKLLSDLDAMVAAERRYAAVAADVSLDSALRTAELSQDAVADSLTTLLDSGALTAQDRALQFGSLVLHCLMQSEDSAAFLRLHDAVDCGLPLPPATAAQDATSRQTETLLEALRRRIVEMSQLACFVSQDRGGPEQDPSEPDDFCSAPV